ncbi:MAG TPA: VWA domain-containing protein [Vicinamibacterales bacterium]|nr:VWA domain-containing protein [Vicinamibacterales bacterium]
MRSVALSLVLALVVLAAPSAQQSAPALSEQRESKGPVFRGDVNLIVVDVVVRDRSGAIVRGLTANDFEIREDNRPQQVVSFNVEEVTTTVPSGQVVPQVLTAGVGPSDSKTDAAATTSPPVAEPITREDLAGRRLIVLLFDLSSMQAEELVRAGRAAVEYVDKQMAAADLVAIATIDTTLKVVSDFTGDREQVKAALGQFVAVDAVRFETPAAETAATDETVAATGEATTSDSAEYDLFNNDARLRALRTLADALAPVEQKKSILYFSGGMTRSGGDNQVELRAATTAAVRANVALYPVDTRGLQAVVPGGDASRASARGVGAFSGRGVSQQFDRLFASQDTLQTLAADTGGRAFTDTNDFGEAFTQVQRDTSSYYLLGYSSTNSVKDGRFRRISVRVKRPDLRVDHRAGYYAERDFAHTGRQDRERQLEEQIGAPVSATDLPVVVSSGYFRMANDRYYVPLSVAVSGAPLRNSQQKSTLDVLGVIRDEQGRPVGRMRETLDVGADAGGQPSRQVLYQSGLTLPPGRFAVKVVVRENAGGAMGSFETGVFVPDLRQAPVKVSSVTLSTLVRPVAGRRRSESPLVREGVELLPSLSHVVDRDRKMYFYYEVYDPAAANGRPSLKTSLSFYRGTVKVFETPLVERSELDVADRRAALFQFEVPAASFKPGLYTCQVNIVDDVAGTFTFPRLAIYVR